MIFIYNMITKRGCPCELIWMVDDQEQTLIFPIGVSLMDNPFQEKNLGTK